MEETERWRDRWRKQRERESLYCQSGNDLMVVVFMNNREMKRQMEETERWMKQRWERWRKQRERWEGESLHWQSGNNLMDVAFINNNISFTSLQVLWKFQKSFYCNFDWQLNQNIRVTSARLMTFKSEKGTDGHFSTKRSKRTKDQSAQYLVWQPNGNLEVYLELEYIRDFFLLICVT